MLGTCIIFLMVIFFRSYIIGREIVSGSSMEPTLYDGDICWSTKFFFKNDINRYDVVIARMGNKKVVKRVIGLPGDEIEIRGNQVYINGKIIKKEYQKKTTFAGKGESIILKKDEYFLLGDNRNHSYDSRSYGSVSRKEIKGIIRFRIYPLNRVGKIT